MGSEGRRDLEKVGLWKDIHTITEEDRATGRKSRSSRRKGRVGTQLSSRDLN